MNEARTLVKIPPKLQEVKVDNLSSLVTRFTHPTHDQDIDKSDAHDNIVHLLAHIDASFREANITYMIDGGTLIGSMLHHGRIPWDDDFDVYINAEDKEIAIEALMNTDVYDKNSKMPSSRNSKSEFQVAMAPNGPYLKVWNRRIPHVDNNRYEE